jgi:hypothetical protein
MAWSSTNNTRMDLGFWCEDEMTTGIMGCAISQCNGPKGQLFWSSSIKRTLQADELNVDAEEFCMGDRLSRLQKTALRPSTEAVILCAFRHSTIPARDVPSLPIHDLKGRCDSLGDPEPANSRKLEMCRGKLKSYQFHLRSTSSSSVLLGKMVDCRT